MPKLIAANLSPAEYEQLKSGKKIYSKPEPNHPVDVPDEVTFKRGVIVVDGRKLATYSFDLSDVVPKGLVF
jgi:hypothetical protein